MDVNTFTEIGEYIVTLKANDFNNNIDTNSAVVTVINSVLGVHDEAFNNILIIYPNPAKDLVIINIGNEMIESVIFYNASGEKVKEVSSKNINIAELAVGTYLIEVNTKSGKSASRKIVKVK